MSLTNFKNNLGELAKPNKFRASFIFDEFDANDSYLVIVSSIPSKTINPIEIPYEGHKISIAGDFTMEDITISFWNDVNYKLRHKFEKWSNKAADHRSNKRGKISEYYGQIILTQLNAAGEDTASYILEDAWPTAITAVELSQETQDTAGRFDVTIRFNNYLSDADN